MTTEVSVLSQFLAGVQNYRETAPVTGKPLLRFVKTGQWVLGAANDDVSDSPFAINSLSIRIGYVAWGARGTPQEGSVVAETPMIPFAHGWPEVDRNMVLDKGSIAQKFLLEGVIDPAKERIECVYSTATDGGAKAMAALIQSIYTQALKGSAFIFPRAMLDAGTYKHSQYGQMYTPHFRIDHWTDTNGKREGEAPALARPKRDLV